MLDCFRWQQASNLVFYLLELSQLPHGCNIAEVHSPNELFFATPKIFARSWLEPAWSFAFTSCGKVDGYALAN
jgi:hypothetical protein